MKKQRQQQLLAVLCLTIWLATILVGHYLFGFGGVFLFGVCGALALVAIFQTIVRWSKIECFERCNFLMLAVLALAALLYVTNDWCCLGLHDEQARLRSIDRLELELQKDPRHQNIGVERYDFKTNHILIYVGGSVATQKDYDSLYPLINRYREYDITWAIKVVGQEEEEEQQQPGTLSD